MAQGNIHSSQRKKDKQEVGHGFHVWFFITSDCNLYEATEGHVMSPIYKNMAAQKF